MTKGRASILPGIGTIPSSASAAAFTPEQYAAFAAIEAGHFWFEARTRLILWALGRHFPEARSFLDVGCGTGFMLRAVRAAHPSMALAGSETGTAALALARRNVPGAHVFVADARALPLRRAYDVAGAFDVLEHIDDDAGALAAMREAIAPGGGLLVTVPQHMWMWSPADDIAKHVRRYSRRELLARVTAAGFDVLQVTSFVSLLLPLMAALRFYSRVGRFTPESERQYPRAVHAAFSAALTVERAAIRAGVSWPAGGSLFLAARRR